MNIEKTLRKFPRQFEYEPRIENEGRLKPAQKFIVVGMGGSHLPAGILKTWNPELKILIHRDYGLPHLSDEVLHQSLIILSSYSGDTEETLDAFHQGLEKDLNLAAISTGGELVELAKKGTVPHIQLPDADIPARLAVGVSVKAHLKLLAEEQALSELASLASTLDVSSCETRGQELAQKISGKIPVIYGSHRNRYLAYNFKVSFNETAKIPAFSNLFPELNHNEMEGFAAGGDSFHFIFLQDEQDDPRIQKRMTLTQKIYEERGLPVEAVKIEGDSPWQRIFNNILTAAWTAYFLSQSLNFDPTRASLVEEFKRRL